jgi:hypothetical protein
MVARVRRSYHRFSEYKHRPRHDHSWVVLPRSMPAECIYMSMILLVRSCLYDQPALAEDQAADHLISRLLGSYLQVSDKTGISYSCLP